MPTVDQYIIQRSPTGVSDWVNVGTVSGTTTTFTDTGLTAETTYYYRVFAQNDEGTSAASNVANAITGGNSDPYFNDVILLIIEEGADGTTTFTDSSNDARTVNRAGNIQVDTAIVPFVGGRSALCDGAGDYLNLIASVTDFDWWTQDYTLEAWIYAEVLSSFSYLISGLNIPVFIGNRSVSAATNYWSFGPDLNGALVFYYFNGSSQEITSSDGVISESEWTHIEMDQKDGTVYLFVDGVQVASAAVSGTPQSSGSFNLTIGQANNQCMDGNFYGPRITAGTARHTAGFTPPAAPFPTS